LVDGEDFASRLQRALDRSDKVRNGAVLTNGAKLIEAKPIRRL